MNQKIRCESCNKVIAEGQVPAVIIINCSHCGTRNDLRPDPRSFTERMGLELKNGNVAIMSPIPITETELKGLLDRMGRLFVQDMIQEFEKKGLLKK